MDSATQRRLRDKDRQDELIIQMGKLSATHQQILQEKEKLQQSIRASNQQIVASQQQTAALLQEIEAHQQQQTIALLQNIKAHQQQITEATERTRLIDNQHDVLASELNLRKDIAKEALKQKPFVIIYAHTVTKGGDLPRRLFKYEPDKRLSSITCSKDFIKIEFNSLEDANDFRKAIGRGFFYSSSLTEGLSHNYNAKKLIDILHQKLQIKLSMQIHDRIRFRIRKWPSTEVINKLYALPLSSTNAADTATAGTTTVVTTALATAAGTSAVTAAATAVASLADDSKAVEDHKQSTVTPTVNKDNSDKTKPEEELAGISLKK
jgi:hypothetical protein